MTKEIEKFSLFEHLNMEKMTPHFLKLAKCTRPDSLLKDIKKPDGSNFNSDPELREYIAQFYEDRYRLPDIQKNNINGCIADFLGPEVLASPLINSMKIPRNLADSLEGPITLFELDLAIEGTKTRTAAGRTV